MVLKGRKNMKSKKYGNRTEATGQRRKFVRDRHGNSWMSSQNCQKQHIPQINTCYLLLLLLLLSNNNCDLGSWCKSSCWPWDSGCDGHKCCTLHRAQCVCEQCVWRGTVGSCVTCACAQACLRTLRGRGGRVRWLGMTLLAVGVAWICSTEAWTSTRSASEKPQQCGGRVRRLGVTLLAVGVVRCVVVTRSLRWCGLRGIGKVGGSYLGVQNGLKHNKNSKFGSPKTCSP